MNLIEAAVAPLKKDAIEAAEKFAEKVVREVNQDIDAHDCVISNAAPLKRAWTCSTKEYRAAQRKHAMYIKIRFHEADFIREAKENAAEQYDAFVAKMTEKIGDGVVEAILSGNHVWSYSILHISKANGEIERWKTQSILNVSKLGKVFNQFPSRKTK